MITQTLSVVLHSNGLARGFQRSNIAVNYRKVSKVNLVERVETEAGEAVAPQQQTTGAQQFHPVNGVYTSY